MAKASLASGKDALVGDKVTLSGEITVITGSGATATVTVKLTSGDTFTIKAKDILYCSQNT